MPREALLKRMSRRSVESVIFLATAGIEAQSDTSQKIHSVLSALSWPSSSATDFLAPSTTSLDNERM